MIYKLFIIINIILAIFFWDFKQVENRVIFFDVGQGDAALVQYNGVNILIDGGKGANLIFALANYVEPLNIHFDLIILSHYHSDHYEGIYDVLSRYSYTNLILPNDCCIFQAHN